MFEGALTVINHQLEGAMFCIEVSFCDCRRQKQWKVQTRFRSARDLNKMRNWQIFYWASYIYGDLRIVVAQQKKRGWSVSHAPDTEPPTIDHTPLGNGMDETDPHGDAAEHSPGDHIHPQQVTIVVCQQSFIGQY